MNNYQINRYKMYGMVIDYLNSNVGILKDFPGFKEKHKVFLRLYNDISEASAEQHEYINSTSIKKKELRRELEEKILVFSRKLKAYAVLENDNILLTNCSFSQWELSRKKQFDLTASGGNLHKLAKEHIRNLAPYGITPKTLKSFRETIDAFIAIISDPRSREVSNTLATKKMAQAYKDADEALRFIDLAVVIKGDSDPDFYSGYRSVRRQLKSGTVRMALKGNAVDEQTRMPVSNVQFTFVLTEPAKKKPKKPVKIIKKTKVLGGFKIMHMPPGKYDVSVTRSGYKEKELAVVIEASKLVRLVVELERI